MELPIFPLHTVLFPGEALSLRIFEQRYLKMISDCMREDKPFGVCFIRGEGAEVGEQVGCFSIGTLAKVTDFDQMNGVLNIEVRGSGKFRINESKYQEDKLMLADVDLICEDDIDQVPDSFSGLEKIYAQFLLETNSMDKKDEAGLSKVNSANDLANNLSSIAPISSGKKQKLLECTDAIERLKRLEHIFSNLQYTMLA